MEKKLFAELVESVREAGAIHRGEIAPSRVFTYEVNPTRRNPEQKVFAICIATDDPELLVPRKIYQVMVLDDDLVKVTDEAGEAAVYPAACFILISLPHEVEKTLLRSL